MTNTTHVAPDRWCRLGRRADLLQGAVRVRLDDLDLALVRTRADELFLVQGVCPHQGGPLADGDIAAATVTCPWHGWRYELRTGRRHDRDGSPIDVYPVRARDGWVEAIPAAGPSPADGAGS